MDLSVRVRRTFMLSQMFGPGFDEEPFDDLLGPGRILAHAPEIGAVSPSRFGMEVERPQECGAIVCGNVYSICTMTGP